MAATLGLPFSYLYRLTGLSSVVETGRDAWLIVLTRSVRMFAYGFNALIMALFFEEMGYADDMMGIFFTMTLLGDVLLSLFLTLVADGLGRRRVLFGGSVLMVVSGAAFALSENYWVLLGAAVVGVVSPSGSEIGPFRAVEESTLSHLTVPETRAEVLTWYIVAATVGTSGGLVFCGNLVERLQEKGWTAKEAYHMLFWIYSACGTVNMFLTLFLSSRCETGSHSSNQQQEQEYQPLPQSEPSTPTKPQANKPSTSNTSTIGSTSKAKQTPSTDSPPAPKQKSGLTAALTQISASSRPTLYKLIAIMSLDSLASGMSSPSLLSLFLTRKFSLSKNSLGTLLSLTSFLAAFTNIFSGAIAKRIGLIKTMVFTHLPSAVFLALLPVPGGLVGTVGLLVARSCLSSLDQAPRSAFIAAVVRPDERTAVMGIVNVVKILAQAGGPSITGVLAGRGFFWLAFMLAGFFKVLYDFGLLTLFVNTRLHQHEGGEGDDERAGDEEDLAGLLSESEEEIEDELGENLDGGREYASPKRSFGFARKQTNELKADDDGDAVACDLASPKGHRRASSFPLQESK